jgi:predicted patatin/cPLA2 family phospholipase
MTNSQYLPAQVKAWDKISQTFESLPGQLSLFHEAAPLKPDSAEMEMNAGELGELFYTGRDLPGAKESDQVILWDVP